MSEEDLEKQRLVDKYELVGAVEPRRFIPGGPTSRSFILSNVMSPFIMGPVGGGKTTACIFKRIRAATLMPPCIDGVIRDRWVVVRSTFRAAEKTILASWLASFPKTYPGSTWSGGNDRPAIHTLRFVTQNGRRVEAETHFLGLNGQSVEEVLRGLAISGAMMNEADTMEEEGLRYLEQRAGRYPDKNGQTPTSLPKGVEPFRQVIGDLNAPQFDNWIYKVFVEAPTESRVLFQQPSGLSADAENIPNLVEGYYAQMVRDNPDWFVQRMVHNRFGYGRDGKPVYDTFNPAVHIAPQRLSYDPNLPLLIGLDGGAGTLKPAAVIAQVHAGWQLRILCEVVPGHGWGPRRFGERLAATLEQEFPRAGELRAWGDPSVDRGADREAGEHSWGEIVGGIIGVPILIPFGGSNEIALRTDAVKAELMTDGATPNMIIDPKRCPRLIKGFNSTYRFKKRGELASSDYEPTPDKNSPEDDVHNALQYLVGGVRGRQAIVRGGRRRNATREEEAERTGWQNGASVSRGRTGAGGRRSSFDPHRT